MRKFSYVLTNRAAQEQKAMNLLSKEAARFSSRVLLSDGERDVPLSEPQSVIELYMRSGNTVTVMVEGKDEEAAVAAMQNYFIAKM